MTTALTAPNRLPWWRYLGPWPLRPISMAVIIALASLMTLSSSITVETLPKTLLSMVVSAVVGFIILWIAENYARPIVRTSVGYIALITFLSIVIAFVRYFTGTMIEYSRLGPVTNFSLSVMRNVLVAIIILAVLGITSRRLQLQVKQTEQALDLVRAQANALLEADETVRQQVAAALHDRVQAGLIGACLQLQSAIPHIDQRQAGLLRKVIDSLEELRGLDVRRAVRSLSPNLREVDLQSALEELSETYSPGIEVTLDIDVSTAPYEVRLGAYRIIEQSLLNSAIHGQASECEISVRQSDGAVDVFIRDNGAGLPAEVISGLGSTLISTWCRTLEGTWTRESLSGGGTLVHARLPVSVPSPRSAP